MTKSAGRRAMLCSLLVANGAFAAPTYPVSARLTLAPKEQQRCLVLSREPDCAIVEVTRSAFAAAVARMFNSGPVPDLELVLEVQGAEIYWRQFDLSTRVRVLSPGGELIEEIEAYGIAPVLAMEHGPIANAESVAAEDAARNFERGYGNSSKIGDYLVQGRVAPALAVAVPPRSDQLLTLAAGLGFVQGAGDDGVLNMAPALRIAGSYRWLFGQATYSHYSSSFIAVDAFTPRPAELTTNDLGLEAGAVVRFTPDTEMRAGPGIHYLFGDGAVDPAYATASSSYGKAAASLYASVSSSFIPFRSSPRCVIALDFRSYFFATAGVPELQRKVPAANTSLAVVLGIELPWGARGGDAR